MQYECTHPGFPFLTYINSKKKKNQYDKLVSLYETESKWEMH